MAWSDLYYEFKALQYTYQSGLLYRLRSLGKVKDLHLTIDGIQRYMFNDRDSLALWILTPALLTVYLVQFYLAAILFKLWVSISITKYNL